MKKILITGYTGMLGWQVYKSLKDYYDVYLISSHIKKKNNSLKFDLRKDDYKILENWLYPDIIIHCAAETNIDNCEKKKSNCKKINFWSVRKLIEIYPKSKFVFISSDSVYCGSTPHSENKLKKPLNYYGSLKLKSENLIRKLSKNYFIIRTTPVGHPGINKKKTFVSWIIDGAKKNKKLDLFGDVFFSPISTNYLIKEIKFILKNNLVGTYNISSKNKISKYNFAKKLCDILKLNSLNLKKSKVSNVTLYAKRNKNQVLDCSLYQKTFKRKLPSVALTIKDLSNNY